MDLNRWPIFRDLDPGFAADVKSAYLAGISAEFVQDHAADGLQNSLCRIGLMVMKNGDVYSIARSKVDVLLVGLSETELKGVLPRVAVKIDALCGQEIRAVSSGSWHVAVLTADGRIYRWGVIDFDEYAIGEPQFLSIAMETDRVVQIACGERHSLALTEKGDVYTWGSNSYGQLGTGREGSELDPVKVSGMNEFSTKIVSVACGRWTSFALDNEGRVWSWGDNRDSALGYASMTSQNHQALPAKVPTNNVIIEKIAVGCSHVLALSVDGKLYFWDNHASNMKEFSPKKIEVVTGAKVTDIGATLGCRISAFKTSDGRGDTQGRIYYWGFSNGHRIEEPVLTRFASMAELFASQDSPWMLKPVEFEPKLSITEKLDRSFNDKETGDFVFNVKGNVIYAHRMVLKLSSVYFRRMFDNDWKEKNQTSIEVTNFTYQYFRTFLLYLYTYRIEPIPRAAEDAVELFKLADYYEEEDLKRRCEKFLELLITINNFSLLYSVAIQFNSTALHTLAHDFAVENVNEIVLSEEYEKMPDELKNRLMKELAAKKLLGKGGK